MISPETMNKYNAKKSIRTSDDGQTADICDFIGAIRETCGPRTLAETEDEPRTPRNAAEGVPYSA